MFKVCGYQFIVKKSTGERFVKLFLTNESRNPNVVGFETSDVFTSYDIIKNVENLTFGADVNVFYDRFGRATYVEILGKEKND